MDTDETALNVQQPLPASSLRRRRNQSEPATDPFAAQPRNLPECLQCHATCLRCTGPHPTDCTECQAAFRFQSMASNVNGSRICVSINDKRPSPGSSSGGTKGTGGSMMAPATEAPTVAHDSNQHSYLLSVVFLGGVLAMAFAAIYLLWLHCFQGSPGISELSSGAASLVGVVADSGGSGGAGGSTGLASIRYDRVHTMEHEDDDSASEEDDEDDQDDYDASKIMGLGRSNQIK